jgi:chromate transporter
VTSRLRELASLFLKLGITSFGGPAVHIAMMENEVVRRRRWMTHEEFLDQLGASNIIPGPTSTELAIHIGHLRAGWPGLIVAGVCFIVPAVTIVIAIGWAYVKAGQLPAAHGVLYGVKPVVIAIVLQAVWTLGRAALKTRTLVLVGLTAVAAVIAGVNELVVLVVAGAVMSLVRIARERPARIDETIARAVVPFFVQGAATAAATPFGLWPLFGVFLKIGAVLFGSGYVLLAFVRADLVERLHWLSEQQLLDAIAVGQLTPGPVFTTATFIGYLLGGGAGAAVATVGIFLPAFVFVALSGLFLPRLRRSPAARAALDGINVASLALMAVVTAQLARSTLVDPITIVLATVSALLVFRWRVNSAWLVLGGAAVGLLASLM